MKQQVNLYQPPFRKEKVTFSTRTMLLGLAGALLVVVMMSAYSAWKIRQLQEVYAHLNQQYAGALKQKDQLALMIAQRQTDSALVARVSSLERLLANQDQLKSLVLDSIFHDGSGYSAYFVAFARQHLAGIWLTGIAIKGAGRELSLQGVTNEAELLPRYLQRLGAEQLLTGLQFRVFHLTQQQNNGNNNPGRTLEFLVATTEPAEWL